jgi:Fic family protein
VPYPSITPLEASFSDAEANSVDNLRDAWVEQRAGLAEGGALSTFNERLVRRWAIETGIVERLYTIDRGTTELLVSHGLDSALIEHGTTDLPAGEIITMLRDHEEAAGYVVDYVAQNRGLTAHFIKSVHSLLTRNQEFVEGEDQFGNRIRTTLRKGEWKIVPNNPRRSRGDIHEYCPPTLVNDEVEILVRYYSEMTAKGVPTVVRAAWLHHRFTQIHPFQDGNGRTARALTAMVFVAANCFPIVVDRDIRDQYIDALEKADAGEFRPLVRLFSLLEKKELEQALSMSEDVLSQPPPYGGTLRTKLLVALRDRAREKRLSITARRQEVIAKGVHVFRGVVVPVVEELARELQTILGEELPGSVIRVELSDDAKRHFFKSQIIHIAQREGYYGDFDTAHEWVRLRLQRSGDEEDTAVNEVVISMHSLGRHFTGVLVISSYFATRFKDETNRSVTLEPHRLANRSLTFSYLEAEDNIADRAREWTNSVLDMGLAQLQGTM